MQSKLISISTKCKQAKKRPVTSLIPEKANLLQINQKCPEQTPIYYSNKSHQST